MRPDDRQLSLLQLRSIDSEFPHAMVESGAVKTESRGCSSRATNHPASLTQDLRDMFAFDRLEFYWTLKLINQTAICRLLQLSQRDFQHRTARKNHCPFDEILKLANITGPAIFSEACHRFGRNRFDLFLHLLGKLLCEEVDQKGNVFSSFP